MLCKITEDDLETQPVPWRPLAPGPGKTKSVAGLGVKSQGAATQFGTQSTVSGRGLSAEEALERLAGLEQAHQETLARARQAALEEGLLRGREEAAAQMQAAMDRLARNIQELAQTKRKVRNEAEMELLKLSLAIARRILYRELSLDPESIHGIVHAALQKLQNREIARIRVYPAAADAVRAALERNGSLAAIEIVPDASLAFGGILFETALGELDASVETQLQEIQRGFADRLALR